MDSQADPVVYHSAFVRTSLPIDWAGLNANLHKGAHVILFGDSSGWRQEVVRGREYLEVRDTIWVVQEAGSVAAVLLRKPFRGPLYKQVLETGTGAINIDAGRIYTDWEEADRGASWKRSGHTAKPDAEKIAAPPGTGINCHPLGRFPANIVFVHSDSCHVEGSKRVESFARRTIHRGAAGMFAKGKSGGLVGGSKPTLFGDEEGKETVSNWVCAEHCPVRPLDEANRARFYKQLQGEDHVESYLISLIHPPSGVLYKNASSVGTL